MTILIVEAAVFDSDAAKTLVQLQRLADAIPHSLRPAFLAEPGGEAMLNARALERAFPTGGQGVVSLTEPSSVANVAHLLAQTVPRAPLTVVLSDRWTESERLALVATMGAQRITGAPSPVVFVVQASGGFDELGAHFTGGAL